MSHSYKTEPAYSAIRADAATTNDEYVRNINLSLDSIRRFVEFHGDQLIDGVLTVVLTTESQLAVWTKRELDPMHPNDVVRVLTGELE